MVLNRMIQLWRYMAPWWLWLGGIVLATVLVWQVTLWAYHDALEELIDTGGERLTLYSGTLQEALSRYAYLPYVLSRNPAVRGLLSNTADQTRVNRYLEDLNREAGSQALYVMDAAGTTLASSNWRDPLSYVGQNYGFRPYFLDALKGRQGTFFAIGVTTGEPGYFMSHPVRADGRVVGVTVVKVDLAPLQDGWYQGGETVLVSDANGVLFLSSRPDWRYRTLDPLTEAQRRRIRAGRQYGDRPLNRLPFAAQEQLAAAQQVIRYADAPYVMISRALKPLDWKLHYLVPLSPVRERWQTVAAIGTVLSLLMLSLGLYARERRQKKISRRKAREAEAIQAMNVRLQEEIAERTRTEQALREAQAELVQTSKLAALGHMAAGIVHELNQPISAIRTQAASGRLLLERRESAKLRDVLAAVTRMTEHMASITAQLKTFARKAPPTREKVILQECLEGALTMTDALLAEQGVVLERRIAPRPLRVMGDQGRIKQVLVNLLRNAVDAMRESPRRNLQVTVDANGPQALVTISDSGSGIAEADLEELFTPFFTTKEVGEGLGLGLSISYRIVSDLGGTIRARNLDTGGAAFSVQIPLAEGETLEEDND